MTDDVLKGALERFDESHGYSTETRAAARSDIRFARLADQWPDTIKTLRQKEDRPCLTVNKLAAHIRNVVNDARQAKPAIKISAVDNGADKDTADVIAGIIRNIEHRSNASVAYDTAVDHQVSGGFGFFRITTDYVHPDSFDMEAKIERIASSLMVHWDTSSTEFDASDWEFAFVSEWKTERDFTRKWPKASKVSFEGDSDDEQHWVRSEQIRLAEYWLREAFKFKLLMFRAADETSAQFFGLEPHVMREPDFKMWRDKFERDYGFVPSVEINRERESTDFRVKRRLMSGVEVLEEEDWPGSLIPVVPVWGDEVMIDGRRHFRSLIRDAKDPQQMFNFWRSASTELVALAPRTPFLGPKGFIPPESRGKWETANTRSHAYLEYDPLAGPAPQRQPFASIPAGAIQEALNASDDIKAVTGQFDASLGARSNETSGIAIRERKSQGGLSNYHYTDNLNRAIQYAGRILVEIIPSVYSARQAVHIVGEDQAEEVVQLVRRSADGAVIADTDADGQRLYDLSTGRYDVVVDTGPSYSTKREEARETLVEIITRIPGAAPVVGDVLMENLDFQGADKIAERLRALLPPEIKAAEGIGGGDPRVVGTEPGMGHGLPMGGAIGAPPPPGNGGGGLQPSPLAPAQDVF